MKIYIFIITIFLCGCNPFGDFKPSSPEIVKKGWARTPAHKAALPSLYCYKTLGDTMCYKTPLKGDQEHLKGSYAHIEGIPEEPTWFEELKRDWFEDENEE